MLQWCCYYLRSISSSSTGEWNSRLTRRAFGMLQMEERLLPLMETWGNALAGASWEGVSICLWSMGSVWLLTRQSSSQEPILLAAEADSQVSYIRCRFLPTVWVHLLWAQRYGLTEKANKTSENEKCWDFGLALWLYPCSGLFTATTESEALRSVSKYAVAGNKK